MKRIMVVSVMSAFAMAAFCGMPDVERISLPGDYRGHLQDVWYDGANALYWAHTMQLIKTDLRGNILAKADVAEHHAGIEVCNGKVYVAVCVLQSKTGGKTLPDSRVTICVYDAESLKKLEEHVTDINDRSGSLCILDDGTFLVGCLRPPDITPTQVRFHHIGKDYKLIKSYVLDNVPVKLGIETIKRHNGFFYLSQYKGNGLCIKLDGNFKEVARFELNGTYGLTFDGDYVWVGRSKRNSDKRFVSEYVRIKPPAGF